MHYRYTSTLNIAPQKIINELSWGVKMKLLNYPPNRRVGISMLKSQTEPETRSSPNEDNNMKMKLFRLMYETVRDSDRKVKRAELIKSYYTNYSSFEIGYILGDITDKFNIITDISLTVKRLYKTWKPVEHINAYEQIANKAIEITHLIDMINVINKRRL
ncbi:unnamed protein product, partial [Brenthis ino]